MKRVLGIILAVIGIVAATLGIILKAKGQISVALDGADGPTAIFVAGKFGSISRVGIIAGIVLLATGIFIAARKK